MCPNLGRGERSIMADLKENLMTGLFGEVPAKPQTDILDEPDIEIDLDQLLDFHSGIVPGKEHIHGAAFLMERRRSCERVLQCMGCCSRLL